MRSKCNTKAKMINRKQGREKGVRKETQGGKADHRRGKAKKGNAELMSLMRKKTQGGKRKCPRVLFHQGRETRRKYMLTL